MAVLQPGNPFPRIALQDAAGVAAKAPEGDTLWAFFKTSCPTCQLTWPYLDRLRGIASEKGGGLSVVAVSQDGPQKTAAFNREFSPEFPTVYDPSPWKASDALGIENVPTLFLVGRDGKILETIVGFQKQKMEDLADRAAGGGGPARLFRPGESVPDYKPG